MIPCLSFVANIISFSYNKCRSKDSRRPRFSRPTSESDANKSPIINARMQIVLIFAGLRGAMSFALVETIPLYESVSGQGSRIKPELKCMTSASILFTVFILGGYTYYLMERLGMSLDQDRTSSENVPLVEARGKAVN